MKDQHRVAAQHTDSNKSYVHTLLPPDNTYLVRSTE